MSVLVPVPKYMLNIPLFRFPKLVESSLFTMNILFWSWQLLLFKGNILKKMGPGEARRCVSDLVCNPLYSHLAHGAFACWSIFLKSRSESSAQWAKIVTCQCWCWALNLLGFCFQSFSLLCTFTFIGFLLFGSHFFLRLEMPLILCSLSFMVGTTARFIWSLCSSFSQMFSASQLLLHLYGASLSLPFTPVCNDYWIIGKLITYNMLYMINNYIWIQDAIFYSTA